jgi:hypothetical protein
VALEIGEDAIASLGAQPREGVGQDLLVSHGWRGSLLEHESIIREP